MRAGSSYIPLRSQRPFAGPYCGIFAPELVVHSARLKTDEITVLGIRDRGFSLPGWVT